MYECFGRLLFANRRPDLAHALLLPAIVDGVRFEYCKNKLGHLERRKVRETKTGREFRVDYSLTEIFALCHADRDALIHRDFYFELSTEVHPTAELLFEFIQKKRFLLHRNDDVLFVMYMAGYVLYLIWREVAIFPLISKRDRRDARHALTVTREAMLTIVEKIKPFAEETNHDSFKKLFLGIYESLINTYDDKYWSHVVRSKTSPFTPPAA